MIFETIWMVSGLVVGFGIAFALRRFFPVFRKRPAKAAPPVYASRQEERKAMREQQKKQQSARKRG